MSEEIMMYIYEALVGLDSLQICCWLKQVKEIF